MDNKTQQYLDRQSKNQKEIIAKIRHLIKQNFPDLKEVGMSEGLWYEGKFYIASFKDHVNLGVGITGLDSKKAKLFEGKGKMMRHLKFYASEDVDENKLLKLMKMVHQKVECKEQINWKK